jgi:hypothetical protein
MNSWSEIDMYRWLSSNPIRGLPDYNLDPPEDDEIPIHCKPDEPDDWDEPCQMLGLHS